jgi:hypothetical protein
MRMAASRRADVEETQTTKGEKFLALVMTAFLLLGGIWTYTRLDNVVRHREPLPSSTPGPAVRKLDHAIAQGVSTAAKERTAFSQMSLARETYRTALEAKQPAKVLAAQYNAALKVYNDADVASANARQAVRAATPAATIERNNTAARVATVHNRQERNSFYARLVLVGAAILLGFTLFWLTKRRASRWFPIGCAFLATGVILSFVLAGDYLTDYYHPFDWGIAMIAAIGIVLTWLLYGALLAYIRRRLPQRRARKQQCVVCGYPTGAGMYCEGCGLEVVATCASCEQPRRVGTAHCAVCGAAGVRA